MAFIAIEVWNMSMWATWGVLPHKISYQPIDATDLRPSEWKKKKIQFGLIGKGTPHYKKKNPLMNKKKNSSQGQRFLLRPSKRHSSPHFELALYRWIYFPCSTDLRILSQLPSSLPKVVPYIIATQLTITIVYILFIFLVGLKFKLDWRVIGGHTIAGILSISNSSYPLVGWSC